jgi:Pyruvate/2-oxoglutarate dehydrogenase complex, dihydrolipoamide acyltransferase (E2) component, and related enzymes
MATGQFQIPDKGEGTADSKLVNWVVGTGETVGEDQSVTEIETDDALVDVPSPFDGTVNELLADEGKIVPVGDVFVSFDVSTRPDESSLETESGPATEPISRPTRTHISKQVSERLCQRPGNHGI